MKRLFQYMGIMAGAAALLTACSPEDYDSPSGVLPSAAQYADLFHDSVDQSTNTAYFWFDDSNVQGVHPVWDLGSGLVAQNSTSKYYRKKGDYQILGRVMNESGLSTDSVPLTFTINKTKMNGFGGFDPDFEYNLFKTATVTAHSFWYAPGWTQIADPSCSISNNEITLTFPEATTDQWQAQCFFDTGIELDPTKSYDFSCIITSSTANTRGVTVKMGDEGGSSTFNMWWNSGTTKLEANEPICVYFSDVTPNEAATLQLIFDFGGCQANTTVNIESLVLKEHQYDDGTVLPSEDVAAFDYNSTDNLWLPIDQNSSATIGGYYAPGWSQIDNAEVTQDGSTYTISLPTATSERWQAQVTLTGDGIEISKDQEYDFCAELSSNNALSNVTCKVQQAGDGDEANNNFLEGTDGATINIDAGGSYKFQVAKKTFSADCTGVKLVFDFGGNPANTTVTVDKITLQKHKE
jgi:hypothetical protein